jgi:hypothetical protein
LRHKDRNNSYDAVKFKLLLLIKLDQMGSNFTNIKFKFDCIITVISILMSQYETDLYISVYRSVSLNPRLRYDCQLYLYIDLIRGLAYNWALYLCRYRCKTVDWRQIKQQVSIVFEHTHKSNSQLLASLVLNLHRYNCQFNFFSLT